MARLIVKQPDGLYAMWSTTSDCFIHKDLTKEQYITVRAQEVYDDKREEMEKAFNLIESGSGKAFAYMKDYDECLEEMRNEDNGDCSGSQG